MSIYLLKEVKKFRADSALEASALVEKFKKERDVVSQKTIRKDKKDETYFIVEVTVEVNSEKNPFDSYPLS